MQVEGKHPKKPIIASYFKSINEYVIGYADGSIFICWNGR